MPTSKPASNKERVLDELRLIKPRNSAGRNLSVAITVGVALGAVVIISLLLGALAWTVLVAAAVGLATWEVCERLRESDWQVPRPVLILGGQLMVWLSAYWGIDGLVMGLAATLMLLLVVRLFLHGMAEAPRNWLRDVAVGVFVVMWIPFFAALAVQLVRMDNPWGVDPRLVIVTFMIGVISNDVGGYAAGVMFGKHPMAPKVSPKKSWEGFGGSLVLATITGALCAIFMLHAPSWQGIVLGIALVISATLGDLMESQFKRDLGIKDMSSILPGHGGLMDRLDGMLPSAAMTWLILQLFSLV
ncbi:phosphatidate cytidylyltransferase [Corynebacterium amycolatum]|uniref:phosphatidate cytidylyltransferase n=1 Tax=Corynebacterium amycolatum TaxID=43765 RepID=UPI000E1749FC|nr:phosphatidate cytidylyltransferase [Corynebacterium amycolatum]STB93761.1 phosphatidate cytidylyltransferase [Corynebacterium amycolatum]